MERLLILNGRCNKTEPVNIKQCFFLLYCSL
jgi:hypothetical protein